MENSEDKNQLLVKPLLNIVRTYNFIDRYTTRYYTPEKTYYFNFTNGLIIMGISKAFLKDFGKIKNIEFCFKEKYQKLNYRSLVSGKKKRGGINLNPNMKLCRI